MPDDKKDSSETQKINGDVMKALATMQESMNSNLKNQLGGFQIAIENSVENKLDTFQKSIKAEQAAFREDVCTHLHDLQKDSKEHSNHFQTIGQQVQTLGGVVEIMGQQVRRVDDANTAIRQAKSEADAKHDTEIEATKSHVARVETGTKEVSGNVNRVEEALGAVIDELGLSDRVQLGTDRKPGDTIAKPTLQKMNRTTKAGVAASVLAAILLTLQIVLKLLETSPASAHPVFQSPAQHEAPRLAP